MGSFQFQEAPFYRQQSLQFIPKCTKGVLPLKNLHNHDSNMINKLCLNSEALRIDKQLQYPLCSIGLLRSKHSKIQKVTQGTCTLIGKNILLTCAHNLYSYEQKVYFEQLEYFPGLNGKEDQKIIIKINKNNVKIHPFFYQYETIQHQHYDYGIVFIQNNLKDSHGFLEMQSDYMLKKDQTIYIFGYPVELNNTASQSRLYGASGTIKPSQNNQLLYYSIKTYAGMSGAPLLIHTSNTWKIIGIHTVSDPSGISITKAVAKTLNQWINIQQSTLKIQNGKQVFAQKQPHLDKMVQKYNWNNLSILIMKSCNITTNNLANFNKINWSIRQMNLDNNKIDKITIKGSNFRDLQMLSLNNNFIGRIDQTINQFGRLNIISIKNNKIEEINKKISLPYLTIHF